MNGKRGQLFWLCSFLLPCLINGISNPIASADVEPLFVSGDHAPSLGDEVYFAGFETPFITNSEQVIFRGFLASGSGGVTVGNQIGIWAGPMRTPTLLARQGTIAPGTGGAVF